MKPVKYYRYRKDNDHRLSLLKKSWFCGKDCLDIGCNEGQFTLEIAKKFAPRSILGIDSDSSLIDLASTRMKRLVSAHAPKKNTPSATALVPRIVQSQLKATSSQSFPRNCSFDTVDVLSVDVTNHRRYDTVLCLSVTKWVQLNHGDDGLMRLFRVMWQVLKPGGIVVLEYQPWKSYVKNKNSSDQCRENFSQLQIKPEDFEKILIQDIGFDIQERLGVDVNEAKGFNRPILVLQRPHNCKEKVRPSVSEADNLVDGDQSCVEVINNSVGGDRIGVEVTAEKRKKKRKKRSIVDSVSAEEGSEKKKRKKKKLLMVSPPDDATEWCRLLENQTTGGVQ